MTVQYLETRDVPLDQLTRYPGNARQGDIDAIRASIARTGQYRALVVRQAGKKLTILAGNHTSMALSAEGSPTARCEIIKCTEDEALRINLADNRLADLGGYDDSALIALLDQLDEDFEGSGWNAEDLIKLRETDLPDEGDAPVENMEMNFGVIIECDSEEQQTRILRELDAEGLRVRALMR